MNFGFILFLEFGWEIVCVVLKRCLGGIFYIYGNVEIGKIILEFCNNCDEFENVKCLNNRIENEIDLMKVLERNFINFVDMCLSNSLKCLDLLVKI